MDKKSSKKAYVKPECIEIGNIKDITKSIKQPGTKDLPYGCCS